ncbi:MAG: hypothetical protein KC445_10300 [Anaerolineales bacterium]|nr:hypothetical protein [Anaerolineales bacterium]
MKPNYKVLTILATLWLVAFLAKPGTLSAFLPPVLLVLSWTAVSGPTFTVSPRHPDIKRVLHSKAMHRLLLRPDWSPPILHGSWFVALALALLLPGLLVMAWRWVGLEPTRFAVSDALWWLIMTPAILCAATTLIEALLMQMVAMPVVGSFIILLLLFGPSGSKLGGDNPATFAYWLPSLIALLGAIWSLWLLDLLRAVYPTSERRRRLMNE